MNTQPHSPPTTAGPQGCRVGPAIGVSGVSLLSVLGRWHAVSEGDGECVQRWLHADLGELLDAIALQRPDLALDAHHITHWVDGGPTSLTNAALLCARHHTIAHQRGWTATATTSEVTWHL